jgi:hypothetical protein
VESLLFAAFVSLRINENQHLEEEGQVELLSNVHWTFLCGAKKAQGKKTVLERAMTELNDLTPATSASTLLSVCRGALS